MKKKIIVPRSEENTEQILSFFTLAPGAHLPWRAVPGSAGVNEISVHLRPKQWVWLITDKV